MVNKVDYDRVSRFSRRLLIALALLLVVIELLPWPAFPGISEYLPVHAFLEVVAVVIAAMVFTVGWHTYQGRADYRTIAVACLFLGVAVLDFSHLLSYQGMPDFVSPSGPEKAIDFWLAARSLAALALLAAVLLPVVRAPPAFRFLLLMAVAMLVVCLHVLFLFFPHWLPTKFDADTGPTAYKIGFEYVLMLIYVVAAYILWQRGARSRRVDTHMLAVAATIMAFSELLLTRYMNFFDVFNVTGHLYKVVAYAYLYQALVVTGIVSPYHAMARSNSRLTATLESIPDLMFEVGADGTILDYHSGKSRAELLVSPDVFVGRKLQACIPQHACDVCMKAIADIDETGRTRERSYWLERDDGVHWYEISGASIVENGDAPTYLLLIRDVTERRRLNAELRIAATAFASQEGIMITDANMRILRVNAAFEQSTGFTQAEVQGQTPKVLQSGRHDREFYQQMWAAIETTGSWQGEIWNRRKNGETYPQTTTITAVRNQAGEVTNYVADYIDISDIKWAEAEISKLSYFDSLTGLINRSRLLQVLEQTVSRSVDKQRFGALLMIDLDQFKVINDTLGHRAGDELLVRIARRLQELVRPMDNVARYGGDEFVVMLETLGDDAGRAATSVQRMAQSILSGLADNYRIQNADYFSTCSIGITLFGEGAADTVELVKQVDIAMFQAKKEGGNAICFFDPEWQAMVSERATLLQELREAIHRHQFELYYQPQLDAAGQVIGAEALVRWNHPVRGLVSPVEFIPLAEQNGLILALGREVLELGLKQLKDWQQVEQCQHLKLSINLVPEQFYEEGFANSLKAQLQALAIDPNLLMLEFTESTLMDNLALARINMQKLSDVGVHFAIDDFGTGYSSLTYLSELPLDMLKIDQSFVQNLGIKPKDAAIVRTIIDMAYTLDMTVLAEGVETQEQHRFLSGHGCALYQGYLFGRPVPAAQFAADRANRGVLFHDNGNFL